MMPLVDAVASGRSAGTMARNVGATSAPVVGPRNAVLATCVSRVVVTLAVWLSGYAIANAIGVVSVKLITLRAACLIHAVLSHTY